MSIEPNSYHIYGRTEYEKPLSFVDEFAAADSTIATSIAEEALTAVGNDGWIELIAIPADAWIQVTGDASQEADQPWESDQRETAD